jgi:hypothetical protein
MAETHEFQNWGTLTAAALIERLERTGAARLRDSMLVWEVGAYDSAEWECGLDIGGIGPQVELILSFPELYIVFVAEDTADVELPELARLEDGLKPLPRSSVHLRPRLGTPAAILQQRHFICRTGVYDGGLQRLVDDHAGGFRPLFDSTQLRSTVKARLMESAPEWLAGRLTLHYPTVQSRIHYNAAAADEEAAFVYLNGYLAYRSGFAVWTIWTLHQHLSVIGERGHAAPLGKLSAIITDWDLAYPDRQSVNLESGNERLLPEESTGSWIVVTGMPHAVHLDRARYQSVAKVPKPYAGIFDLRDHPDDRQGPNALRKCWKANEEAIVTWLKQHDNATIDRLLRGEKPKVPSHSAPFSILSISDRLVRRARHLMRNKDSMDTASWVQAALLAGEGRELLGSLSRTAGYECLAIQHEAEVAAELSFLGTSVGIAVTGRLDELSGDVKRLLSADAEAELSDSEEMNRVAGNLRNLLLDRPEWAESRAVLWVGNRLFAKLIQSQERRVALARRLFRFRSWRWRRQVASGNDISRTNFLLRVVDRLRTLFAGASHVESSEKCHVKLTKYDRKCIHNPLHRAWTWYLDLATNGGTSAMRVVLWSLVWIFVFTAFYCRVGRMPEGIGWGDRITSSLGHSFFTFAELQQASDALQPKGNCCTWASFGYYAALLCEIVAGYLHLGLFLSVVYRRLIRRAP